MRLALLHAFGIEPMGETRGTCGERIEAQNLIAAIGARNTHSRTAGTIGVASNTFVSDVEMVLVAVEQIPKRFALRVFLSIGVRRVISELGHQFTSSLRVSLPRRLLLFLGRGFSGPPQCHNKILL